LPPWTALGLSRATFYRRRRASVVAVPPRGGTEGSARPPRSTNLKPPQHHKPMEILSPDTSSIRRENRDSLTGSNSSLAKRSQTDSHCEVSASETLANSGTPGDRPSLTLGRAAQ
jgi:hypothetical protein